jgi:integrase/recombinase XerD
MRATEGLVLYKRHSSGCPVVKMDDLSADAKRHYMDCECPIWVVGRTANGHLVPRQSTGARDLETAQAQCKTVIAKSNAVEKAEAVKRKTDAVNGPTIRECADRYLESRRHELGEKAYSQHQLLLNRLTDFCAARGIKYARDMNVDLLEQFKVDGLPASMASTSKSTSVAKLRCFLKVAYRRGWTTESLREKVTSHKAVYEEKSPYTDEEVEKMLAEALKLSHGTHGYAKHPKTFRLLLELMLETGMRVGDAIRYDPKAVVKGKRLWIYRFKAQKQKKTDRQKNLDVYLTDRLKKAIDECAWLSPGLPFHFGSFNNPAYLSNEVYERMKMVGSRCGVGDCRPHRLRDTFAVRKLLSGVQLDDVSRFLGHSSVRVTEQYYAKWNPGPLGQAGERHGRLARGRVGPRSLEWTGTRTVVCRSPPLPGGSLPARGETGGR